MDPKIIGIGVVVVIVAIAAVFMIGGGGDGGTTIPGTGIEMPPADLQPGEEDEYVQGIIDRFTRPYAENSGAGILPSECTKPLEQLIPMTGEDEPSMGTRMICVAKLAAQSEDYSLCDAYGEYYAEVSDMARKQGTQNCLLEAAREAKDPDVCRMIDESFAIGVDMDHLMEYYILPCVYDTAVASNDVEACESLGDWEDVLGHSRDGCIYDIAINTDDGELCERLPDDAEMYGRNLKDDCKNKIGKAANDPELCEDDYCLTEVATNLLDASICAGIGEAWIRDSCYSDIGKETDDVDVCKMAEGNARDNCLSDVAADLKDLSICDSVESEEKKLGCVRGVAVAMEDVSLCEQTDYLYEGCVRDVAKSLQDPSLCEVLDGVWKTNCIEDAGGA